VHQTTLVAHVDVWDPETAARLGKWTQHFSSHGADAFTAGRQALSMLYRDALGQAQVLAFIDDFRLLAVLYASLVLLIPFMHRVRHEPAVEPSRSGERVAPLPTAAD
jgi:hypothetical protein